MSRIVAVAAAGLVIVMGMNSCKLLKFGRKAKRRNVEVINTPPSGLPRDTTAGTDSAAMAVNAEKARLLVELTPLWLHKIDYTTFSGKAKMTYEGKGQSNDFTANFRMRKDSVVWVSITAVGGIVSVAKALITPDSIKAVNYLQKEVYLMKLSDASKVLPAAVDFATLQRFIIGNALMDNGQAVDATDFGGTWTVQMNADSFIQQLAFNKADSTLRTSQLRSVRESGPAIIINYGNYSQPAGRRFADSRAINILNNGEQSYLDMNFSNVNFDQPLEYPFSVPSKYTLK